MGLSFHLKLNRAVLTLVLVSFGLVWGMHEVFAVQKETTSPTVIVMSASWCGTCRELNPIVEKIVKSMPPEENLEFVVLDVDSTSAVDEAKHYGVSVSGSDLPQVYLASEKKTILLYNGSNYHFGQGHKAEEIIRQRLKTYLPGPH